MSPILLNFPEDLLAKVDLFAKENNLSRTAAIKFILTNYLKEHQS